MNFRDHHGGIDLSVGSIVPAFSVRPLGFSCWSLFFRFGLPWLVGIAGGTLVLPELARHCLSRRASIAASLGRLSRSRVLAYGIASRGL